MNLSEYLISEKELNSKVIEDNAPIPNEFAEVMESLVLEGYLYGIEAD